MLHLYIALKSEGRDWDRLGRYKMQDSDTRDLGSHPESHVCSDLDNKSTLVQVGERLLFCLNVKIHIVLQVTE